MKILKENNKMEYRKDITEFMFDKIKDRQVEDEDELIYHIYEHEGKLYFPQTPYGKPNIIHYFYPGAWVFLTKDIKEEIENKFNVKFAIVYDYEGSSDRKGDDIFCKCGCSDQFSAFNGSYEGWVRCNKCGNEILLHDG